MKLVMGKGKSESAKERGQGPPRGQVKGQRGPPRGQGHWLDLVAGQ